MHGSYTDGTLLSDLATEVSIAPLSHGGRPLGPSEEELAARAAVAAGERTRAAHAQRERVMAHMIALDEATGHAERDFD